MLVSCKGTSSVSVAEDARVARTPLLHRAPRSVDQAQHEREEVIRHLARAHWIAFPCAHSLALPYTHSLALSYSSPLSISCGSRTVLLTGVCEGAKQRVPWSGSNHAVFAGDNQCPGEPPHRTGNVTGSSSAGRGHMLWTLSIMRAETRK